MACVKNIDVARTRTVLEDLLGRDITIALADLTPHPATLRGLVDDQNNLLGAIGADLPFAHYSGAALALMPAGAAEDAGDEPSELLVEVYQEVANVVSRLINEVAPRRMRIDPGLSHENEALAAIVGSAPSQIFKVTIKGYGEGHLGFWLNL